MVFDSMQATDEFDNPLCVEVFYYTVHNYDIYPCPGLANLVSHALPPGNGLLSPEGARSVARLLWDW